jgi:protein-S-isoprenylcysteine O-methyltransferase Ste14
MASTLPLPEALSIPAATLPAEALEREPDSHEPRRPLLVASGRAVLLNYCSAVALLLLGYAFYALCPYYQSIISPAGYAGLRLVLGSYLLVLPLYYASYPDSYTVKCRLFWRAIFALPQRLPTRQERVALLAVLVKAIYLPLMINWLIYHIAEAWGAGQDLPTTADPLQTGYLLLCNLLFVVDVLFFAIGYAIEHPRLGNEIRSVEPTLLGWLAALTCYPPLNLITTRALGWYTEDYPEFSSLVLQVVVIVIMLLLMVIYVWASVALGFKASNLTNRGTVDRGPYAWIRHPAYISKNLFWCLGALPWLFACAGRGDWGLIIAGVVGLAGWCCVYTLRAITEEHHLGRDADYQQYCRRVRYRFIPGVW